MNGMDAKVSRSDATVSAGASASRMSGAAQDTADTPTRSASHSRTCMRVRTGGAGSVTASR